MGRRRANTGRDCNDRQRSRRWLTNPSPKKPSGGRWTPRQVTDILTNPVYRGQIHTANGPAPGTHEAIIAVELFNRVREAIAGRRVSTTPRGKAVFEWLLRGLVVCGRCGRTMSTSVIHHRQLRYRHYRCRSHAGGRPPCKGVAVPAHLLEQWVIRELSSLSPERFRLPQRRQEVTDFQSLWAMLSEKEQIENMTAVVEQVHFDPTPSKILLSLRPGAVGAVAGIIAKREQAKEPEPRRSRRKHSPADEPLGTG